MVAKNGTNVGPVDLSSDVPPQRHLEAKSGTTSDQIDIWLAFGSG